MRLPAGPVLAALVLAFAAASSARAAADDPWNGRWSVSLGTANGHQQLVRRNITAASLAGTAPFTELVTVTVPLPKGGDYTPAADLNAIEALLVDALERDHKSIGVLVLTTDTARDFVFYTSDGAWAAGIVEALRPKAAPYQLQVHTSADPRWELYASFAPAR